MIRQWQILLWLANSRRPLSAAEVRAALGLACNLKTVHRDIEALAIVFDLVHAGGKWTCMGRPVKIPASRQEAYGTIKRCVRCSQLKERETEFWRDWKEPDQKDSWCRACRGRKPGKTRYARNYYRKNRVRILAQRKRRYDDDKLFKRRSV